jgi:predicted SprT family Zn-dependent metalloprotease
MSDHDSQRLREHALKLWSEELYREYENIQFQFRVRLRPALIRIEEVGSVWGTWNATTRTIVISRLLIERHSWDVVIEVLKHEMAHQLASEAYGGGPYHDEPFKRACARLGVAAWAAKASGPLPESIPQWRDRALSPDDERLLKRVEKLLALANSANEHEALAAMQKVQELYAKHELERLRGARPGPGPCSGAGDAARDADALVHLILTRKRRRTEAFESMIYSILAEHFFVRVVFGQQFDAQDLERYQTAELTGTRENVLMAEYVHHFLWNQIHSLWRHYQERTGKPVGAKKSYMLGVLSGFRDKLGRGAKEQQQRVAAEAGLSAGESWALVSLAKQELDEYVARRHPRLVSRHWNGGRHDGASFTAGVAEGERLTLRRGLGEHAGQRGLRLGSK